MANTENLKMIRFATGEEIMGEILENNKEVLKVNNPIRVVIVPSQADPKNPQVGFAPYGEFSADKEFVFNAAHVMVIYTPIVEFINQYNSMFGGLVVPPKSGIITP